MQIVSNGSVTSPRGFLAGGAFAGIKTHGAEKKDLGLLVSTAPCAVAGGLHHQQGEGGAGPPLRRSTRRRGGPRPSSSTRAAPTPAPAPRALADAREMAALAADKLHLAARGRAGGLHGQDRHAHAHGQGPRGPGRPWW